MKNLVDISSELNFRTARSGGKGGQNVNKVETMVEARFEIEKSNILNTEQKALVLEKLASRINNKGELTVRSQESRTQLRNKARAIARMNTLINKAIRPRKKRKATKPTTASKEKRLKQKKVQGEKKKKRQKNLSSDS